MTVYLRTAGIRPWSIPDAARTPPPVTFPRDSHVESPAASPPTVVSAGAAPAPAAALYEMRRTIRSRHYSHRTEKAYLGWARRFLSAQAGADSAQLGGSDITRFPSNLAVHGKVSASTQNQAFSAILFLFRDVLKREVTGLGIKDLDFARHEITIHDGKGRKDRVTVFPARLTEPLRRHLERIRDQHARDVTSGAGSVALPHALGRKYPHAAWEWVWQWVFPATFTKA
jgi:site-specific recombinase XerD